ncbi:MAG: lipid-A-disaccharide synthase [Candidatus Riflebacteria bacterium]|nr:lipid-A-disaccharide synthase [Candidatus Riflebacteria bacterium]
MLAPSNHGDGTPPNPKRVMIVAGETSGDMYAASLLDVMFARGEPLEVFAVGGPQMRRRQVKLLYDSDDWAAIGYIESIKLAPRLLMVLRKLYRFLETHKPDLLILVDYPGFNMRLARRARVFGIPTLFYFPPSKFATNPDDVADAARTLTCVAANFTFTYKLYKEAGANVEFVGHPLIDQAQPTMNRKEAFEAFALDPTRPVIGLCPGSRKSELIHLLPVMLEAAKMIAAKKPNLQFVVPVIATGSSDVYGISKSDLRRQLDESQLPVKIVEGRIYDVMAISELLLISSGTATLEATHIGTPMIIGYRVSLFTEIVAKLFNKLPRFIGLPNIIIGRQAVPELVQHDFTPENLARHALELLESPERRAEQKSAMAEAITHLGKPGAHNRVADLAFELLRRQKSIR